MQEGLRGRAHSRLPRHQPPGPTHVLVIPKGPYVSFDDFSEKASDAEITAFVRAVGKVARDAGVAGDGYRILANIGGNGHQEVPHLHVHIFGGRQLGRMLPREYPARSRPVYPALSSTGRSATSRIARMASSVAVATTRLSSPSRCSRRLQKAGEPAGLARDQHAGGVVPRLRSLDRTNCRRPSARSM